MPLTYYVQFRDASGNLVTGTDGRDWFQVNDLSVNQQSLLNPLSSGTTGTAPVFNPLTFQLGIDTVDPVLLAAEANGTVFSQIEVAGYSGTGSRTVLVTDDLYRNAVLSSTTATDSGMGVAFEYAATVHRFYPIKPDGSVGAPVVAGYNLVSNSADTSDNNVDGTPGHAPAASLTAVPATTNTTAALTFFVQFRNSSGVAMAGAGGQTWFAVTGLAVPAERVVQLGTNSSSTGTFGFDPLSFTVEGAALAMLLQQQATGAAFGAVELAGYDGSGATATLREVFTDKGATVAHLVTGADGSHTVTLNSTDLVQTVIPATTGGRVPTLRSPTQGWNTVTNKADNTPDTRATAIGVPDAAPTVPLTYYVQFRDGTGALLTGDDGNTWFAAFDVGFGSTTKADGSLSLDPLTVTLGANSVLGKLFASQAVGASLRQVEVAGYDRNGARVSDDVFKGATALAERANGDGTTTLTYAYLATTETTYRQNLVGQATPLVQGYNTLTQSSDTSTRTAQGNQGSPPNAPATTPTNTGIGSGLTYYVQFRNASGAVLAGTGGATWFAVSDVGFATTSTGGNARIGFGGLSFTLAPDRLLPTLFQNEAAGVSFQSVELAGYAGTGSRAVLVQDNLFKLAAISNDTVQADGRTALTFQYAGLLETSYTINATGDTVASGAHGWNNVRNTQDDTTAPLTGGTDVPLAAPVHGTPTVAAAPDALSFFVQFHDSNGALVTDAAGASWFAVSNVTLPTAQTVNLSSGAGTGSGRVIFDPVSFTLNDATLLPKLFVAECSGSTFQTVEFAGYTGTGSQAVLVQDSLLKLGAVSKLTTNSDDSATVGLQYGGLVERSYTTNTAGTTTLASTGGWNRLTNSSDTGNNPIGATGGNGRAAPAAPLSGEPANQGGTRPLTYFVQFLTYTGATADSRQVAFLPINDLSFSTEQALSIGSQSTGAGAGKVTFGSLSLTLEPDAISTALLGQLASGTPYKVVNIVGYDTGSITPRKVITDQFKLVAVNGLTTNADGSETLELSYGALAEKVVYTPPDGNSGLNSSYTAGWNRVINTANGSDNYQDDSFSETSAPNNALPSAVCYCRGSLILTDRGERPIETLAAGDTVVTATGVHRRVRWVGHTVVRCAGHPDPLAVLPVRVRADAFGEGLPASDLLLSPGHAVCPDLAQPVLVRISDLLNGATIVQEEAESVEYWHLELDTHDLLVANGMPAESYINVGNRAFFADGTGTPDGVAGTLAEYCRPLAQDEATIGPVRERLVARARTLGWFTEAGAVEPQLVVDGTVLQPEMGTGLARFLLPAGAREVWLVTPTFVPRLVGMNADMRSLGLELGGLSITDGGGFRREVRATDPLLCLGFHAPDAGTERVWTTGRARLPAALWAGCAGSFVLAVAFDPGHGRPTWQREADTPTVPAAFPVLHLVRAA